MAGAGLALAPAALAADRGRVVATRFGPVRGLTIGGVHVFKGVRYAAPPVGALRFKPPQNPERWSAPLDAFAFGHPAVQMYTRPSGEPTSALGRTLMEVFPTAQETRDGAEDCLVLNVWTRGLGDGRKRPVMVWFHGGGYVYGSGAWPAFDGANLARRGDVVVVTVNHRLNVFGHLYLDEMFGPAFAGSGNAGLLDLVAALQWVRNNVAAFGGDAGNVTIFGQSGGGAKVSTLMATPAARGLFHKAIIESGPSLRALPKERARQTTLALLDELKIKPGDALDLQNRPSADFIRAAYALQARAASDPAARIELAPVVDGGVLPRDPFTPDAPPQGWNVPLLIGTNKDEAALFMASQPWFGKLTDAELVQRATQFGGPKGAALLEAERRARPGYSPTYLATSLATDSQFFGPSVLLAERKAKQTSAYVFMYRMDWETPIGGGVYRAGHSLETPLVFDNVETTRAFVGPGPEPQIMADMMSRCWIAFARSANPNAPGVPLWPAYDAKSRATMIFDLKPRLEHDPMREVREILTS
jgi:para-nitrobenzyl esterase